MKRIVAFGGAIALCLGLLGGAALAAPASHAAPPCDAQDSTIYTPPGSVRANAGEILACRPVTLPQVPTDIPTKAWKVQYASADVHGHKIAVSGTVAVPEAPWTGTGPRPVIAYHPGTLGLGSQCALSKQLAGEPQALFEPIMVADALKAGFAVAATDGVGYLIGQTHTYVVGHNAGKATLDIARTALRTPEFGLDRRAKVGIWGYSEGGAASLWAAQLARSYAPELRVVGDASGGIPADLRVVATTLDGGPFAGLALDAAIGVAAAYPNLPLDSLFNETGRQALTTAKAACLVDTVLGLGNVQFADYTTDHLSLEQVYEVRGSDGVSWGEALNAQKLGVGVGVPRSRARYQIGFPVLQYRAENDQIVGNASADAVRAAYCTAGITTEWKIYPGTDHLNATEASMNDVIAWFNDRFAGKPTSGNC